MDQHQETTHLLPLPQQNWEVNFKARVLKSNEWEKQRQNITELYLNDSHSLPQVRKIMAETHNFYAKEAQYKKKIKAWGLGKNLSKKTALALLEIQRNREIDGKSTTFNYKGRLVRGDKLERSRKRFEDENRAPINGVGATSGEPSPPVVTPSGVEYFTPSSNSGDTESIERTVLQISDDAESTGEVVSRESEDMMMDIQELDSPAVTSLDAEDPPLCHSISGVRNSSEAISQSVGGVESIEEVVSQNGRSVAIKDAGSHLVLNRLGDSYSAHSPRISCLSHLSQVGVVLRAKMESSHFTSDPSEQPDKPIKIRSSDDRGHPSPASDFWIGLGLGKSPIGSLVRNDVVMSGISPFKTPISVTSPYCLGVPRGFSADCCGDRFHTTCEMINHYENNHTQQNHDRRVYQALGNASGILASLPPLGGVDLLADSELTDMSLHNTSMVDDIELVRLQPEKGANLGSLLLETSEELENTAENDHEVLVHLISTRDVHILSWGVVTGALEKAVKNGHEVAAGLILERYAHQLSPESAAAVLEGAAINGHEAVVRLIIQKATYLLSSESAVAVLERRKRMAMKLWYI